MRHALLILDALLRNFYICQNSEKKSLSLDLKNNEDKTEMNNELMILEKAHHIKKFIIFLN